MTGWFAHHLTRTRFVARYPHYAGVLARMDPLGHARVPVMAVALRRAGDPAGRLWLLVNRDWLERHPQWFAGVLLHEIQHVVLGHLGNRVLHAVRHPDLMELAMELSANEGIGDPLPPGAITLRRFAGLGIEPGQSTLQRYQHLARAHAEGRLQLTPGWRDALWDLHRPSEAGAPGTGLGDQFEGHAVSDPWRHRWRRGLGPPASDALLDDMRQAIASHLGGDRGGEDDPVHGTPRRPGTASRVVFTASRGPTVDWPAILREVLKARRQVHPDYRRPNRRFGSRVGEIPGRTRRRPRPALLVAIDTSASMQGSMLDQAAIEVKALAPHAHITLVEADAAVQRIGPLRSDLGTLLGGGDTDFGPAFEELDPRRYDGMVYFTDGRGRLPDLAPTLPTVWGLLRDGPFAPGFGTVVRIRMR
ncbi:MAG: VWA-like domain-containing protein [Myxococcota bacterium]